MKKAAKIASRTLLALGLTVYVAVALLNYSLVQSALGSYASRYFSRQWGGEVHIGALHAAPWDHLMLNNVRLVAPDGDTILDVKRLRIHFKRFPYSPMHLELGHVSLTDGYFHLAIKHLVEEDLYVTNLQYIFDSYQDNEVDTTSDVKFTVDVHSLTVRRMRYKQDLPEEDIPHWPEGVDIAHMDFRDIYVRARDIHVVNDDVSVRLLKFKTREKSGMTVDQVEGDVHVSPTDITVRNFELRTPQSHVLADVEMLWDGWGGDGDYLGNVRHDIELHPGTVVDICDAAYWAPVLWGVNARIEAEGHVKGTINDMHISDFSARWGKESMLQFTGDVRGLPDIAGTVFDIDIERLRTTQDDVRSLGIVGKEKDTIQRAHYARLDLSDLLLRQVDYLDLNLRLHGGLHEMGTANLQLGSGLGNLHADAQVVPLPNNGAHFTAEVGSSGVGLRMLRTDWLSHTGFSISLEGQMDDLSDWHTLEGEAEGQLVGSVVRGHRLAPIDLNASMSRGRAKLRLQSTDTLARLVAEAEASLLDQVKSMAMSMKVDRLDAAKLDLLPEKYGEVSTRLTAHLEGSDLDTMQAEVRLVDTRIGAVKLERVALALEADEGYKSMRLESDALDATVGGHFGYYDLPLIGLQLAHDVLPQDLFKTESLYPHEKAQIAHSDVGFHLHWRDDGRLLQTVAPTLKVARGTRLDGSYNATEQLKLVLRSDSLGSGSIKMDGVGLNGRRMGGVYRLDVEAQELAVGELPLAQDVRLGVRTDTSEAHVGIKWDSENHNTEGDLELLLRDGQVVVQKHDFTVGGTPWLLEIDTLHLALDTLLVHGKGIRLRSDEQSVETNLDIANLPSDRLELWFDKFDLKGISDIALQGMPVGVGGQAGGRFSLYGLSETPYFNANMKIDSCIVNNQYLGDVSVLSNWNAELNTVNLQLTGDNVRAGGWLELAQAEPGLNLTVDFDRFDLGLLAPLLTNISSRFEGLLHGSFEITGTTSAPLVVGEALVESGALRLDMTGVTYYFNDSIKFTNNLVSLNNFAIHDPKGNIAILDGGIHYDNLDNIKLDLRLQTERLLVLDRSSGDEFYGTLLASAEGAVQGPVDALKVNVNARTLEGSTLTVPVNDQRQVKTQNYITFVTDDTYLAPSSTPKQQDQSLNLEMDLAITPDVQLNLPMDFSEVTVKVGGSGTGDLHLSIAGNEEPQVVGSYEINSGTMKVGLISLIEKTFSIESGSSLNFQGSLPNARFDLSAVYSQRVNLSTLTGGVSEMGGSQKYLQVEDVINIAGTLQEPTIGFDIRLPGADASVEEEVFAYIDRNSERDMLNQTVSLLVSGHFYNANSTTLNGGIATTGGIGALSSLLTDMVSVVDIDVDYKAGNELTKDQLDVNISKDWGRWYLESTLGYGGESRELQTSTGNTAVIDALLGYRLSPLVHLFAYNRTNTNDYTRMDLPYKQGVGLKLTKDFDTWADLFRKSKK